MRSVDCFAVSKRSISASGAFIQPTRKPGASIFDTVLRYSTRPVRSSDADRSRLSFRRDIVEIQLPVRIVLDDQDVATLSPLEHPRALDQAEKRSRRILKIGHEVQQLDRLAGARRLLPRRRRGARD